MKMTTLLCSVVLVMVAYTSAFALDEFLEEGRLPEHNVKAHAMLQEKGNPGTAEPLRKVSVVVLGEEGHQWVSVTNAAGNTSVFIETAAKQVKWYARHTKYGVLEGTLELEKEDNTPFSTPLTLVFEK